MSRFAEYCTCGSTLTGRIEPDLPADDIREVWLEAHRGEGHYRTDVKGAAAARRRQDRERAKGRHDW